MEKLLLVDGNSMLFRAYYATAYGHAMTSSKGIPTNAVYGFAMMLQKAIDLLQPENILVAFDAGKHTFRHDIYPDYKGGRKPAPDDLVPQFAMVRDYLDGYGIPWVEQPDIEADDLIGSMALQYPNFQTTILSSDHDLLQLVDESTHVLLMKKGISEFEDMSVEHMKETMGIVPSQIIDLKALMGDSSDNIPGIPGVGEKTAYKLLAQYDTVENVLAHDSEIKGALGKKIQDNHEKAELSKTLATIKRDVKLPESCASCKFQPNYQTLVAFFKSLDMNSLVKRYEGMQTQSGSTEEPVKEKTTEKPTLVKLVPESFYQKDIAIFFDETQESFMQASIRMIGISDGKSTVCIHWEDACKDKALWAYLKKPKKEVIGFDIKRNLHLLDTAQETITFTQDAMILASLADSTVTSVDKIWESYGLMNPVRYEDVYGTPARPKMADESLQVEYVGNQVFHVFSLYQDAYQKVKEYQMEDLYQKIEWPLTFILYEMEKTGITTDLSILKRISKETQKKIDSLQKDIYQLAGSEFNINSPKQLGEVLYDKLGLPSGKKRSTSADVLEKISQIHPIIPKLLDYRKLSKINSTYAEGLQRYIWEDGKIHTIYNQCATQTGRLSSSEPNLQNISVRDEQGKEIRKAFLPSKGCVLISSDYSQIELRMLAHMANEKGLIEAFHSGIDIHTKTAMDIFGVKKDEVTPLMRRQAKTVNFGIVYGISNFGLGEQLGISRYEAQDFIDTYYKKYPGIQKYMKSIVEECEKNGYVSTISGRRRDIPEIHDKNHMVKEFGKRAAMNAPIQGSAADLIKIAMIHIDEAMKKAKVKSKMILQVHDELIFDVPKEEVEQMKTLIEKGMDQAMKLKVPLQAEAAIGNDWYEAK